MLKKNKINFFNSFNNDFSGNPINLNKGKKYYIKNNLTIKNSLSKDKFSFSFDINEPKISLDNNDNDYEFDLENQCIMSKKCPFYNGYVELKNKMNGLLFSIKKIKKLNEILLNSLNKQTKLYQYLINENKDLKEKLFYVSQKKYYTNKNSILNNENEEKKSKEFNINQILEKDIKSLSNYNINNILNFEEDSQEFKTILLEKINKKKEKKFPIKNIKLYKDINVINKAPSTKNIRYNNLLNNREAKKHYELINEFTNQQNPKFISVKMKRSFLSDNINYETLIKNNKALNELILLTKSEDNFILTLKNSPSETYFKYFDMISLLINDYKDMLKLGIRMKEFIKISISLIDSMIDNNSIKVLIENTCSILSCDRASLFILDKISDSLIVYSGEGVIKAQIKVPKDKGIVGACFMDMKKIRIDDAYLDKRFNREIDKKTNYRTKSVLCYPLIDKEGQCFGVIEAINKLIPPFNNDDEELLKLLAYQASIIFRSFSSNDDNKYFINKLIEIIDYNTKLYSIKSKFDFTEKTENALLIIFNCMNSKFYFVENNKIIYYNNENKEKIEYDINLGIIGKVIKNKKIIGYQNIKNCKDFNPIIDIKSSDGILTIPILEIKTKNIKGVAQVPYLGVIYENNKPKEVDYKVIKKLRKCIKYWFHYNNY